MSSITIQILEGLERGRIFADLDPPLTIGREEENTIRLNDERVSRYHVKVQSDGGRIILTDLDSTNGTRVNGHPVQLRILQPGDLIEIGRCLLLYGSPAELQELVREPEGNTAATRDETTCSPSAAALKAQAAADQELDSSTGTGALFPEGAPALPENLRPHQQAALSDLIAFVHEQLRLVLQSAEQATADGTSRVFHIHSVTWSRMVALEAELASLLRRAAEPKNLRD